MSERKVLNKYYPPDFDPSKIPRRSKSSQQKQINVRNMLSMTIRCDTCSKYIYRGTKVNSRKETVHGKTYLGITIHRFYIKCTNCAAEIVMNTDPRNSGYVVEAGARRNFEPQVDEEEDEEEQVGDGMEIRRLASKREMDTLSTLDELKSMKARRARVSVDSILEALNKGSATLQLEEDKDKDKDKDEDKQQLDVFQRSRRMHVRVRVDSMLDDLHPLQKQRLDVFQRSRHDGEEVYKKRKPTYHYLSVPKKSSVPKTQETSNGLALLCQHYDSIDEEAN